MCLPPFKTPLGPILSAEKQVSIQKISEHQRTRLTDWCLIMSLVSLEIYPSQAKTSYTFFCCLCLVESKLNLRIIRDASAHIYMNVSKHVSSNLPNIALSTFCHCAATHLFLFFYFRALVCFWCMWESAICLLSPLLFCQRLQRLFHKGPSPGLPQTQSSPQQISFTPNPGDTAAISAANSILQQPAVRLS